MNEHDASAWIAASQRVGIPEIAVVDVTGSTNADLAALGRAGAPHGSALVALRQTSGRGRLGRIWASGEGNLHLSILVRPAFALDRVPLICLAAAVAVADAVGNGVAIKWPNDVLAPDGRKVAGILAEVDADGRNVRHVIVGIGINVAFAPIAGAACLAELGVAPDLAELAARIVRGVLDHTAALAADPARVLDAWRARSATIGRRVRIGAIEGDAVDVAADGALIVRTAAGTQRVLTGDVEMVAPLPPARPRHGLVIGKFYPPHAGHHLLVRTAAACADRVTVVVAASSVESVPLAARVAWMREVHTEANVTVVGTVDDAPIDLEDDAVWRAHVDTFRAAAACVTAEPVDAVFTSEAYGDELARRLAARHVPVDPVRGLAPISGTAVRRDPIAAWDLLSPPVRAFLSRRVVIIGAESTGKTVLAERLADALRARGGPHGLTRWAAEVGREFTIDKLAIARANAALANRPAPDVADLRWEESDFVRIATAQNAREDALARIGGPVLVCDTDAFATSVWHRRYRGSDSTAVEALARRGDLYLLLHADDLGFVQDGLRDGEAIRGWMTDEFARRLQSSGRRWRWVRGEGRARVDDALAAIDAFLAEGWGFADPLG